MQPPVMLKTFQENFLEQLDFSISVFKKLSQGKNQIGKKRTELFCYKFCRTWLRFFDAHLDRTKKYLGSDAFIEKIVAPCVHEICLPLNDFDELFLKNYFAEWIKKQNFDDPLGELLKMDICFARSRSGEKIETPFQVMLHYETSKLKLQSHVALLENSYDMEVKDFNNHGHHYIIFRDNSNLVRAEPIDLERLRFLKQFEHPFTLREALSRYPNEIRADLDCWFYLGLQRDWFCLS